MWCLALAICRVLQAAAQKLEQRIIEVQVIFKGKLVKGDSLWLEFRGERFPLDCIFGILTKKLVRDDVPVNETGFNLSS